jgi:serine/threonine-protein kinase
MTEKKATLLFVDDEERILRSLKMLFRFDYKVHTTTDGHEALNILRNETVHLLISDQRMPIMTGVELLRQAREISPNTMRLLLTGYSDLTAIVGSVNEGEIFRYINKPWDTDEIQLTVRNAADIGLQFAASATIEKPETPPATEGTREQLGVLVIDDDPVTYQVVKEVVGEKYVVKWGTSLNEAFAILSDQPNIALVISEVKVANEDITSPLKTLKQHHPNILTIVLTSFQDTGALIELINQGQIYRFLPKPALKGMLEKSIQASIRHYNVMETRPQLMKRYAVEKPKKQSSISDTIMGYIRKIRAKK